MTLVRLYAAGSNARGQLAHNSSDDSDRFRLCHFEETLGPLNAVAVPCIAAGANHTLLLARRADGTATVWGCGDGSKGQLAYPREPADKPSSLIFRPLHLGTYHSYPVKLVAAAWETSYAVVVLPDQDVLLAFGSNDFGDLGVGFSPKEKPSTHTPLAVSFDHLFADKAHPPDIRILDLKAGTHHAVVKIQAVFPTTKHEFLAGWGASRHGQLGEGSAPKPSIFSVAPQIVSTLDVISFSLGSQHTICLTSGQAIGLGSNKKRQIHNLSNLPSTVRNVATTWNGSYFEVKDGDGWRIYATGNNSKGQLGHAPDVILQDPTQVSAPVEWSSSTIRRLACGSEHVLLWAQPTHDVDEIWGWGWNEHGNLGLGHSEDVHIPNKIWPPSSDYEIETSDSKVMGIWAGCGTSWIAVQLRDNQTTSAV